jgi:ribosome biogenesis GTPase A
MLKVLKHIRRLPLDINPATGGRIMVVGMPNVGKSTIINGLRAAATPIGLKAVRAKAAATGADPGITRRIGQGIKLFERRLGPVYLVDTPGVFVPYVEDPISMLKLSLCGIVKDTLISPITKADYILYHINKIKPFCYLKYCPPTNDIQEFLTAFAKGSGCYAKGRVPDLERAAQRWVHLWRSGEIPGFVMDDVDAITEDLRKRHREEQEKAKPSQAAEEQEDYEQEPDEDVVDYEEDEADEELAASIRSKL